MTDRDIHDAFERMRPSQAAKDRMLENLLRPPAGKTEEAAGLENQPAAGGGDCRRAVCRGGGLWHGLFRPVERGDAGPGDFLAG